MLAGWTEYPYPESMYAATRAGVPLSPAVPERLAADGKTWEPVCDLGFPAGLPRVMTRALSGFTPAGKCVLRIRTNMQVYWYQVYLATAEDAAGVGTVTVLEPARADLAFRGFIQEVYPGGRPPVAYDDAVEGQADRHRRRDRPAPGGRRPPRPVRAGRRDHGPVRRDEVTAASAVSLNA